MNFTPDEISAVMGFIKSMNSKHNSIVVVEGKRDEAALKKLGFTGKICQFHSFKGLIKFADSMPKYKDLILLLDSDRKGRYLTKRIITQLQHRMTVDLSYRRQLTSLTKGRIRNVGSHHVCPMKGAMRDDGISTYIEPLSKLIDQKLRG